MKFATVKYHGHTYKFHLNRWAHFYFTKVLNMAMIRDVNFVLTNAETLCLEFCNSALCHILVNYLTFYLSVCPSVRPH
jgi:hypothetical protein